MNFKKGLHTTSRQPSNAGGFRRLAFTKSANDKGEVNIKQAKPAIRLPSKRYAQKLKQEKTGNKLFYIEDILDL